MMHGCIAQGTITNHSSYILYMYTYDWVTLLYSRNWQNIVNQLYFNFFKKNLKRKLTAVFFYWKSSSNCPSQVGEYPWSSSQLRKSTWTLPTPPSSPEAPASLSFPITWSSFCFLSTSPVPSAGKAPSLYFWLAASFPSFWSQVKYHFHSRLFPNSQDKDVSSPPSASCYLPNRIFISTWDSLPTLQIHCDSSST